MNNASLRLLENPNIKAAENLNGRPLYEIAGDIERDWSKIGKGVNYAAKPYLHAMYSLNNIDAPYGADSGVSVVLYFLSNANSWRGEKAKAIKAELKAMLKARGY